MAFKKLLIFLGKLILWGGYVSIIFINFISLPIYDFQWMYVLYIIISAALAIAMPTIIWLQFNHIKKLYDIIEHED